MLFEGEPKWDVPDIPDDLTAIDDRVLMRLFSREVAWQNFFGEQLSRAQIDEKYAEADLKMVETMSLMSQEREYVEGPKGGRKSVTTAAELKAKRDQDPKVQEAQLRAREAWAHRKAVEVAYESRERCAQLYSRELTRRTGGGLSTERRDNRWRP